MWCFLFLFNRVSSCRLSSVSNSPVSPGKKVMHVPGTPMLGWEDRLGSDADTAMLDSMTSVMCDCAASVSETVTASLHIVQEVVSSLPDSGSRL